MGVSVIFWFVGLHKRPDLGPDLLRSQTASTKLRGQPWKFCVPLVGVLWVISSLHAFWYMQTFNKTGPKSAKGECVWIIAEATWNYSKASVMLQEGWSAVVGTRLVSTAGQLVLQPVEKK